eukprot:scaffold129780_cov53-Attheya_sp.AAC.2
MGRVSGESPLMTGHSLQEYPDAVCLDGTSSMYYHHPGFGNGSDKWYIEMQGGGWCGSFDHCVSSRLSTTLGSSSNWPSSRKRVTPFFEDDPLKNPLMYNWNKIYFPYCDGFSFSGNVPDPVEQDGIQMHLKGKFILDAGITDMLEGKNLKNATDVVIGGCSAGGLSTILHCDKWADRIRDHSSQVKVACAPESGFFMDYNATSSPTYGDLMVDGVLFHQPVLPSNCVANEIDPSVCVFAENVVKYVETPLFIMQPIYDSWARGSVALSGGDSQEINNFGATLTSTIIENVMTIAVNSDAHGIYLDSCLRHCNGWDVEIDGVKKIDAFKLWYENEVEGIDDVFIQGEDYLCESCCFAPTPQPSTNPIAQVFGPWTPVGEDLFGLPPLNTNTLVEFGDSVVLCDAEDGSLFMAVGAPHADYYYDSNNIDTFENPNGGLIRLFKYSTDLSAWVQIWSFPGDVDEEIGYGLDMVNLSPTLNRIAIRRADKVIIRDIDSEGNMQIIGAEPPTPNGKLVKLNSAGTIMAVASETLNGQKGRVEVFHSSDPGGGFLAWTSNVIFDGEVSGDRLGYSLAIDDSGTRVAFGIPYKNDTGIVQVYDYDGSGWTQVGTDIIGTFSGGIFGWSLDMSADGKRLLASATGSYPDDGSITDARGSISVYEEHDNVWHQIGNDIEGEFTKENFGRAVTMDSTGTRIAASSFKYNNHKGRVRIFQYNDDTDAWDEIMEIAGESTFERMGRGISSLDMTGDGTIIGIGSRLEENGTNKTGKVQVLELQDVTWQPSSTPTVMPSIAPSASPSVLPSFLPSQKPSSAPSTFPTYLPSQTPSGLPTLTLSADPSVIPSSSPSNMPNTEPSDLPSYHPSQQPSSPPSSLPSTMPSQSPSTEPSPSPSTSQMPTFIFGNENDSENGWDILKLKNATIAFNDESKSDEIKMFFNISNRNTRITVFEADCRSAVDSSVVEVIHSFVSGSETHGNLTVSLDMKEEFVMQSPIWSLDEEQENLGNIDICVRVELLAQKTDGSSIGVNFLHAELSIAIDMAIGFNSASVEMEEESLGVFGREVSANFVIESCQCNAAWECASEPEAIVQAEFLNICLSTNSSGTRFESLDSFRLSQSIGEGFGTLFDAKVQNGVPMSEVTSVAVNGNGNKLKITTQPANFFFLNTDKIVIAEGFAVLEFGATGRRRFLKASVVRRALETEMSSASFTQEVSIRSGSGSRSPSSGANANGWSVMMMSL